ncbi:MAG: NAD kinase [Pseudomonadota bacterium]
MIPPIPKFQRIALIGKYKSPEIARPLLELAQFLEGRGVTVLLDELTAGHVGASRYPSMPLAQLGGEVELVIVLGGDGTMLNIARILAPHKVAVVGVNQGRLGFLTDVSQEAMLETLGAMLNGDYVAEERMLIEGEVRDGAGNCLFQALAFNDIAVNKGVGGSMVEFEVRIDGQFVYVQRSDGLVIATPTGSTAYALSAGGPILHPSLDAIALVPVCPHTLSARPIIVSNRATVELIMHRSQGEARAHFDGHFHWDLREGDRLVIRRAEATVRLLHPASHSYYHMLREKLHWSEAL